MRKIPKLRFKEFSDDWEEKKLGEILKIFNGYAFSSKDNQNSGAILLKIANVDINKMKQEELSFLPLTYLEKFSKYILKKGDIVIALTRPLLNRQLKIAEIDVFFDNSLLNQRVGKIETNENKKFIYNIFQKNNYIKEIEINISGSDPPNLSTENIKDIILNIPSIQEQEKIANFLSSVDKKISLTEEKLELFREYKKGVMQKIFSQELRFKDSNGNDYPEWEEKKLGEIAFFSKGKLISKEDITEEGVECIRYGELYTIYKEKIEKVVSKTKLEKNKLILSEKNDVIIPSSGETAIDIAVASCVMKDGVALGADLNIIKTKENGLYLAYFINNPAKLELASLAQGASVIHLYEKHLKLLNIKIPTLEEQEKIADFLSSIDSKIESIEKELEGLKEFKKGLLQQMFI
ncbi:restriction endonuclease subunit S [uncultured Fusobacterium sp.]|uniref:restriction endonuclease subunit S n=1 Tax=uncultured Fusobacterium sp. TaxID=159267 RepID=UPI00263919DA|nr:restriction endonuclease subunit S [uncultured Fusobacterium sp.]